MRGPIIGHSAKIFDAQKVFLNGFENIVNRRVDIYSRRHTKVSKDFAILLEVK